MTYRADKFTIGDKVLWSELHLETAHFIFEEEEWSDGPFTITKIIDRPYNPPEDDFGQSNWSSMGHTQHVFIAEYPEREFSGAFFTVV